MLEHIIKIYLKENLSFETLFFYLHLCVAVNFISLFSFALPFERVEDKVGWTLLFQRHWYHSLTVSVIYYALIRLIQWAMEDRKPFDLRWPLFLWNAALAVFSVLGFLRFSEVKKYLYKFLGNF